MLYIQYSSMALSLQRHQVTGPENQKSQSHRSIMRISKPVKPTMDFITGDTNLEDLIKYMYYHIKKKKPFEVSSSPQCSEER